jgi:hypothetical protein
VGDKYVKILTGVAVLALSAGAALAVTSAPLIVTAETPKSQPAPSLSEHDVIVHVNNQPAEITAWHALRNDPAGLELWIMIDDGTDTRIGTQFNDIKAFIRQQSREVKVAIGYLRNGSVVTAQKPTADHEAAVKAIRLPYGMPGISASPYIALADFLHKLPVAPPQPREIVLISSGVDPYYGPGPQNPYLENAFHDAQKAGVPIYTIYYSGAGHAGHSFRQINWGQNDLSELSEETGGEFYWQGNTNPVALQPFFDDINHRYAGQYVMSVEVPKTRSGFERLKLHTESPHVTVVGAQQVYVP